MGPVWESRRWVVIETGSNQALVFGTNKQRLSVAASRLIWQVGFEWIDAAIEQVRKETGEPIEHVMRASGLGVLLASEGAGRAVIEAVTRRALVEAPDLTVWGVVGAVELTDRNLGVGLAAAQRDSARHRASVPSVSGRDPNLPFTQVCAYTGRSAVATVSEGAGATRIALPASAGVHQFWKQTHSARGSLVRRLQAGVGEAGDRELLDAAVVGLKTLEAGDGVGDNGWVAVLHADGNGIGDVFANLRRAYHGTELVERLSGVSEALETAAWAAVAAAIVSVSSEERARAGWVLPILVGGDDITVMCDARYGFAFTIALAAELERRLDQELIVSTLARVRELQALAGGVVSAPRRVSVAAGLVFTKPHHPFSHSVSLAEELTRSAKTVKGFEVSAVDVLVLHESAVRDLSAIRADLHTTTTTGASTSDSGSEGGGFGAGVRLWAGPIVLGAPPPELAVRGVDRLREAIGLLATGDPEAAPELVPSGVVHDLRAVLTSPHPDPARLSAVVARARVIAGERRYRPALERLLDHLVVEDGDGRFSRLLTAMELADVTAGTRAGSEPVAVGAGVEGGL